MLKKDTPHHKSTNQKKNEIAMLLSGNVYFRQRNINTGNRNIT